MLLSDTHRIEAIVVETLTGRELVEGKIFIDATGSADVVARAGAPAALDRVTMMASLQA